MKLTTRRLRIVSVPPCSLIYLESSWVNEGDDGVLFPWKVVGSYQATVNVTLVYNLIDKLTENEIDQNIAFWETRVKFKLMDN